MKKRNKLIVTTAVTMSFAMSIVNAQAQEYDYGYAEGNRYYEQSRDYREPRYSRNSERQKHFEEREREARKREAEFARERRKRRQEQAREERKRWEEIEREDYKRQQERSGTERRVYEEVIWRGQDNRGRHQRRYGRDDYWSIVFDVLLEL